MTTLLTAIRTEDDPFEFVSRSAVILREFGWPEQDSGNRSWLVQTGDRRLFIKTAGPTATASSDGRAPYFDQVERIALLRNAVELARSCRHRAMPALLNVIESPAGPLLVYEAVPGELIHARGSAKHDPTSAYRRFARMPLDVILRVLDELIDVHRELARSGWVAVDLYDGSLIVDFDTAALAVIDLDTYRRGPSVNDMGRMFGSSTLMAPEEFHLGATIDQRTTVFTLCRLAQHFLTGLTDRPGRFRGPSELAAVLDRGCIAEPDERFPTVEAFADAWVASRSVG